MPMVPLDFNSIFKQLRLYKLDFSHDEWLTMYGPTENCTLTLNGPVLEILSLFCSNPDLYSKRALKT